MEALSYEEGIREIDAFYAQTGQTLPSHQPPSATTSVVSAGPAIVRDSRITFTSPDKHFPTVLNPSSTETPNPPLAADRNLIQSGPPKTPLTNEQKSRTFHTALGNTTTSLPMTEDPAALPTAPHTQHVPPLKTDTDTMEQSNVDQFINSSGSKESLFDDMRDEETGQHVRRDNGSFRRRRLPRHSAPAMPIKRESVDTAEDTEDAASDADAPSSPVSVLSRLKEAASEARPQTRGRKKRSLEESLSINSTDRQPARKKIAIVKKRQRSASPKAPAIPTDIPHIKPTEQNEESVAQSVKDREIAAIKKPASKKRAKRSSVGKNEIRNLVEKAGKQPELQRTRSLTGLAIEHAPNAGRAAKARQRGKKT